MNETGVFWVDRAAAVGIGVAFTDNTLDLGDRAPQPRREAALAALAEVTGREPIIMSQVHGAEVAVVTSAARGGDAGVPVADALVTDLPDVALVVRVADCVPILLVDPDAGLLGAVHAGRQGVVAGVIAAAVSRLRQLGGHRLHAWVGPHICGGCYEVPEVMRDQVAAVAPAAASVTTWGTPALDLGRAATEQLNRADVAVHHVAGCTREDPRLHSFRRDGERAGRGGAVVWRT